MIDERKAICDALAQNDLKKIAEYKAVMSEHLDERAIEKYLKGFSLQTSVTITWGSISLAVKAGGNAQLSNLQIELLKEFCNRHGLTFYTDVNQIQPSDSIITTWKHNGKTNLSYFRVLQSYGDEWVVSLSMWEDDEIQFEAHKQTQKINKKNFVVGVCQRTPHTMKKPQTFYFINFFNMELTLTGFETAIKQYLDNLASEDAAFAKTYEKPNKSISECCRYIYQEVGKKRKGVTCVACTDEEVYGMAIHYYDEDDIEVAGPKAKVTTVAASQPAKPIESKTEKISDITETPKPKRTHKKKAQVDPDIPEPLEIPFF